MSTPFIFFFFFLVKSTPFIISYLSFEQNLTHILIYTPSSTIANTCHNPLYPFRQSVVHHSYNPTKHNYLFYFIYVNDSHKFTHYQLLAFKREGRAKTRVVICKKEKRKRKGPECFHPHKNEKLAKDLPHRLT